jgi:hypothetical protein
MQRSLLAEHVIDVFGMFPYQYEHGPCLDSERELDLDSLWTIGINCQLFVHMALEELFGMVIPRHYRSSELFSSTELQDIFRLESGTIMESSSIQAGDICFFGRSDYSPQKNENCSDAKKLHLGIFLDANTVAHCCYVAGGVVVEPLQKILAQPRYQSLYAVRRIKK